MNMKIAITAIMAFALAVLPLGFVQQVEAQASLENQDPVALISNLWTFLTEKGPQLIGQLFEIVMAFVFSIMAFLQTILAMIVNPQGLPLLFDMGINGISYAFSYAISFAIYGGIISVFVPILPIIVGVPLGAIAGLIFGFLYGFSYAENSDMPDTIENPFIEGWPYSIYPQH